jgi:hypothetical protein
MDRQAELTAITSFAATRGVTRCPPRFAAAIACAMPQAEEKARIDRVSAPRLMTRTEIVRLVYL